MELTAEQQVEYDKLHKELVAQGGPNRGKLKAAGHKDPDGVARLIELGWKNPEATLDTELEDIEREICDDTCEFFDDDICSLMGDRKCNQSTSSEHEIATKEAEEAQIAADEAVKVAEDKAKVAESKKPAPCWRCGGDEQWHSTKTGVRAKTSSEPLHNPSRTCPECN